MFYIFLCFFILPVSSSDSPRKTRQEMGMFLNEETEKIGVFYVPMFIKDNYNFTIFHQLDKIVVYLFGKRITFINNNMSQKYNQETLSAYFDIENIFTLMLKLKKIQQDKGDLVLDESKLEILHQNTEPELFFIEEIYLKSDKYDIYQKQEEIDDGLINIKSDISVYSFNLKIFNCFRDCCCRKNYTTTVYNYKISSENYKKYQTITPAFAQQFTIT